MAQAVDGSSSSARPAHVVLVDDDRTFLRLFAANLQAAGYQTECFDDPRRALKALQRDIRADACILDWQMPDLDGLELLKALRERGIAIPVLFLTSHGQPIFEEAALDAGAVDFVDKSRGPAIILHRLSLALTRQPVQRSPVGADRVIGALALSPSSKRVRWHGSHVPLSHSEFDVVELLARNAGREVGYREMYDAARSSGFLAGQGEEGYRANVRAIVKRIRRKFEQLDPAFTALQNYPGFGYRWHQDD
jgi:two-component system, OmpR family, response regulator ChvI